jgi:hypothetical protein
VSALRLASLSVTLTATGYRTIAMMAGRPSWDHRVIVSVAADVVGNPCRITPRGRADPKLSARALYGNERAVGARPDPTR